MNSIPKIYRTGFLLVASALLVFAGVDVFYKVLLLRMESTVSAPGEEVAPRSLPVKSRQAKEKTTSYQGIVGRNLFGGAASALDNVQLADVENLQETTLDLTLLGTIDREGNGRRAIILDNKTRRQDIYREGDSVEQALVKKILRGRSFCMCGARMKF